jgi:DNA polymerase III subunit beta
MDIIVACEALLKPLQAMSGVVEKKQVSPILSHVLLNVTDDYLALTATDLDIELIGFVRPHSIQAKGSITVSARKLFDICRTLPGALHVSLTVENNQLVFRSGESCFILNTLPANDFPALDQSEYPYQVTMNAGEFKSLLTKTYFSMGLQDVRSYLNGVLLDLGGHGMRAVAADGHRLALSVSEKIDNNQADKRVIVPRKSVMELIRLLDQDEEITLSINDQRIKIMAPDLIFTSKLINAQYPDYNRLMTRGTLTAIGDREAIKQALTRTAILSNEKFRGVRFHLVANRLCLSANNADQEHAEEVVPLEYTHTPIEMAFNVAYLLDILSAMAVKTIRFVFSDANSGLVIEPIDGDSSVYVVMPLRL